MSPMACAHAAIAGPRWSVVWARRCASWGWRAWRGGAGARPVPTEPRLLLFDEPLSNLDAGLRERMRFELLALQRRLGRTSIYVTHDQAEAMVMSDRIILMNGGRIVQENDPRTLY